MEESARQTGRQRPGRRFQDLSDRLFPSLLGVFVKEVEPIRHGPGDDAAMVEAGIFLPLDVKTGGLRLTRRGPPACAKGVAAADGEKQRRIFQLPLGIGRAEPGAAGGVRRSCLHCRMARWDYTPSRPQECSRSFPPHRHNRSA